MRILVCGARTYTDREKIWRVLSTLNNTLQDEDTMILINGQARGADRIADDWAVAHLPEEDILRFPANWTKFSKAAGPIRNREMLEQGKPNLVLAFGGRDGTGTNHMVSIAVKAGIPVLEFDRD